MPLDHWRIGERFHTWGYRHALQEDQITISFEPLDGSKKLVKPFQEDALNKLNLQIATYNANQALREQIQRVMADLDSANAEICRLQAVESSYKALQDRFLQSNVNAPWLTQAHMLCTDVGIPQGDISWRLEVLRGLLTESV